VRFWRDNGGACALAAFGLPTDAALAANDAINDRAAAYKAAKLRPEARMDQLRVLAFLDLLNGITLQARTACDRAAQAAQASGVGGGASTSDRDGDGSTSDDAGDGQGGTRPDDGGSAPASDGGHNTSAGDVSTSDAGGADSASGKAGDGSTNGDLGGGRPGAPAVAPVLPALTARANLTLPLATMLGLAERPGAAHGLGPLDPALVRDLAATAAGSPHSQWCITITDTNGVAVAHGCAKPARTKKNRAGPRPPAVMDPPGGHSPHATTRDRPAAMAPGPSPCPAAATSPSNSSRSR
jgi:hypothetical protein